MLKMKYQLIANNFSEGITVRMKYLREIDDLEWFVEIIATVLYTEIWNRHTVKYPVIGPEWPKSIVSKRPDWSRTTKNNRRQASWLVRNVQKLYIPGSITCPKWKSRNWFQLHRLWSQLTMHHSDVSFLRTTIQWRLVQPLCLNSTRRSSMRDKPSSPLLRNDRDDTLPTHYADVHHPKNRSTPTMQRPINTPNMHSLLNGQPHLGIIVSLNRLWHIKC